MINRIYISSKIEDARASVAAAKMGLLELEGKIRSVAIVPCYTIDKQFSARDLQKIASSLENPVVETAHINDYLGSKDFDTAIEVGFLPGVTDNVAHTAADMIQDQMGAQFSASEDVYSSQIYFIKGARSSADVAKIAESLYNPLIQRVLFQPFKEFQKNKGSNAPVPKVQLHKTPKVSEVNLTVDDKTLEKIGSQGIFNNDGKSRGPLALDLLYMKAIQAYFKKQKRNPTDIELESLAQTWSEHCKHTIFADPIDDIKDGLYKTFIKRATEVIRKRKGAKDFCVSVFKDNSGAIAYDEEYLITHKMETHNSPSALDPFGGALTGIVGVNRDALGFGLGAKPIANLYGFCLSSPTDTTVLYRNFREKEKLLSSYRIMQGVVEGINAGGNTSGIPTPLGFVYFDPRYRGKPLVFAGTIGLIPRKVAGRSSHEKRAMPGDYIVMLGGRVGADGIHGATFSSQELHESSPATSVQIGDPITQKKFSDALVREARDLGLYNSITDNGAGGLSSSVSEMAKESGGCIVDLEKVPLKYPGLDPWQIWISESQERMTLAVPQRNWKKFKSIMDIHEVEATIIGIFTSDAKCIVRYKGKKIMDVDMDFLHYGLPPRPMKTMPPQNSRRNSTRGLGASPRSASTLSTGGEKPEGESGTRTLNRLFLDMLSWENHASYEFISRQYDHEVQSTSIVKPLQGKGRVNGESAIMRPVLSSKKAIILGSGVYPSYSDIDTYHMAASSIDSAIRTVVAAGGQLSQIALLDNFCWSSPDDPTRLYQLKEAARACYDYATTYETPFISGKDSMHNDFKGYDEQGKFIKISVPPTLLISSLAVVDDHTRVISMDAKSAGDLVYVLGETREEIGGSQYSLYKKQNDVSVPRVDAHKNKLLYEAYHKAVQKGLVSSAIAITKGGLGIAMAKTALAGILGVRVNLQSLSKNVLTDEVALYSESQGRILATVAAKDRGKFEQILKGTSFAQIGKVTQMPKIVIKGLGGRVVVDTTLKKTMTAYKSTFMNY